MAVGAEGGTGSSAGLVMLVTGALALKVQFWAGPSHIMQGGINYADTWHSTMIFIGCSFVIVGIGLLSQLPLEISIDWP